LSHAEAVTLKRTAKQAKHFSTPERAAILLASNAGHSVPQIAAMWMTDEHHVRRVIHDFNERGMARWTLRIGAGVPAASPPPAGGRGDCSAPATYSAPASCTKTASASGCGRAGAAGTTSPS
jgi:hypothetical protein